jgi:hypothetical protein
VNLSYRWLDAASSSVLVTDGARGGLATALAPGESRDVSVMVRAPAEPGRYVLRLSMVQEGVAWFVDRGASGVDTPIDVGER